jgi:tetratricopeptide (TPR) repeat protein
MRKICILGILTVSACGAQPHAPTLAEVNVFDGDYLASLRVTEDVTALSPIQPPGPQVNHPPAGSVSVAQLRHKPPKNAQKSMARGARFSQAGDHRRAAEEFDRAVTADRDFASAHRSLGEEYALLGRYSEAEAELQRSLTLDPDSWIGHYNLAAVLYATGNLSGAERSARRALELSKTDVQARILLGLLLWDHVETRTEALEHLQYAAGSSSEARELLANLTGK